jgi:hypothetical protein
VALNNTVNGQSEKIFRVQPSASSDSSLAFSATGQGLLEDPAGHGVQVLIHALDCLSRRVLHLDGRDLP